MNSHIRRSTRKIFQVNSQDLVACLGQKNSTISVLQSQVQSYRMNEQRHLRIQEDLRKSRQKYQSLLKDYQSTNYVNQQRLELTVKALLQVKNKVLQLKKQLQSSQLYLKELKSQSADILQHNNLKQDQIHEIQNRSAELDDQYQTLQRQSNRLLSQIKLGRQQFQKQKIDASNAKRQIGNAKQKSYKIQSYNKSLMRESDNINENLKKLQQQNNYLDSKLVQLNSRQNCTIKQAMIVQQEIQQNKLDFNCKELKLSKILKLIKQNKKMLNIQRSKIKPLIQQCQQKQQKINRLQYQISSGSQEINVILSKNKQIIQLNLRLNSDLIVCNRHLQNVMRINKAIQDELIKFKQINLMAIKKLQQPLGLDSNGLLTKKDMNRNNPIQWTKTPKMQATGTGFENQI